MVKLITPVTPSEQVLYCTVRIEGSKGTERWTGTGFIIAIDVEDEKFAPILVTNRHVVNNAEHLVFKLHVCENVDCDLPSGKFEYCDVAGGDIFYPDDESIDLAAFPIASLLDQLEAKGTPVFFRGIGLDSFPSEAEWSEFDVLEDVVMVGCPNGLYDSTNNYAIFRKGSTASSLAVDYDGRPEFLVDIACFGGSSGSPIFTYNVATKFNRETKQFELGGRGMKFAGVLYAGPTYQHEGTVIMRTPVINLTTTMHLGFAIKSSEVRLLVQKVLDHFCLTVRQEHSEPAVGALTP